MASGARLGEPDEGLVVSSHICQNFNRMSANHTCYHQNSMETDTKTALKSLLSQRSLILGPTTLSNGSHSNHYFDCKRTTLNSTGAWLVGDAVLSVILEKLPEWPAAIGGLTHGADPIVGSVIMRARECGLNLDGFYVRKEPKQHGTKNLIENAPEPGSHVVIVDDVVTGGGSVLKAVDVAEQLGCHILAVIALIDRLEGGTDRVRERVERYFPLFTLDDFRFEIEQCQANSTKSELQSAGV
jgi:orotate phosphoribosyltransferase